jgi:hypothetical protein
MFGSVYRLLDQDSVARFLDEQDRVGVKSTLTLRIDDPRVDWGQICGTPSPDNPSIDLGQAWSRRCQIGAGRALHFEGRGGIVLVHIDHHDPAYRPVQHVLPETHALSGLVVGLIPFLFGVPIFWGVVSAAAGATIGAHIAPKTRVWEYAGPSHDGSLMFSEIIGATPQGLLASAQ